MQDVVVKDEGVVGVGEVLDLTSFLSVILGFVEPNMGPGDGLGEICRTRPRMQAKSAAEKEALRAANQGGMFLEEGGQDNARGQRG